MTAARWAYADTSVLVKRYVLETGSAEAGALTSAHDIVTSALAPLEILSAFHAKRRAGSLPVRSLHAVLRRFQDERRRWTLVEVTSLVLTRAEDLVRTASVRTLDAVHLASAMFFRDALGGELPFLTADDRQRRSAEAIGLDVFSIADR